MDTCPKNEAVSLLSSATKDRNFHTFTKETIDQTIAIKLLETNSEKTTGLDIPLPQKTRNFDDPDVKTNQIRDQSNGFKETENDSELLIGSSLSHRRGRLVLVFCTLSSILEGCSFSLLAPLYPAEALSKGMSETLVSVFFSLYNFIIFVATPLLGNYLTTIGPKCAHLTGVFCTSVSTILFGCIHHCPAGTIYVVLSFTLQCVEAFGISIFMTANFTIASNALSDQVSFAYGIIEMGVSIGYMVGPVIGGALFEVGGFQLPFYVIGGVIFLNGALLYCLFPYPMQMVITRRQTPMSSLFKTPSVLVPLLSVFAGAVSDTFFKPILANELRPFRLSPTLTGLIFAIMPLFVALCGPAIGYMTDTRGLHSQLIVLGHFILSLAFFILGQAFPFLPFEIWTVAIGLGLSGAAYECTLLPPMKCVVLSALESGFEDSIDTYAVVTGVVMFVCYLGGITGPLMGGAFTFKTGTIIVALLNAFVMILCFVFFTARKAKQKLKGKH